MKIMIIKNTNLFDEPIELSMMIEELLQKIDWEGYYYQRFLDLSENILILQDLFISIKEHTNNDLNKKRKFLISVLNQRLKYFISSIEGFKFSNELLKNLILEKLMELQHKINSTIELVIY